MTQHSSRTLPPSLLLGFAGHAGSGKDTCAQILAAYGFRSIAFADALRGEVAEAWRIDARMLSDRETKEWDIPALAIANCADTAFVRQMQLCGHDLQAPRSPRFIMQRWGTEYRRAQDGDYWVKLVVRWAGCMRGAGWHQLAITDVRFRNEMAAVRSLGGHVLRVHRPDAQPLAADTGEHVSEALPLIEDLPIVHNDGDLGHLESELVRVLQGMDPWHMPARAAA